MNLAMLLCRSQRWKLSTGFGSLKPFDPACLCSVIKKKTHGLMLSLTSLCLIFATAPPTVVEQPVLKESKKPDRSTAVMSSSLLTYAYIRGKDLKNQRICVTAIAFTWKKLSRCRSWSQSIRRWRHCCSPPACALASCSRCWPCPSGWPAGGGGRAAAGKLPRRKSHARKTETMRKRRRRRGKGKKQRVPWSQRQRGRRCATGSRSSTRTRRLSGPRGSSEGRWSYRRSGWTLIWTAAPIVTTGTCRRQDVSFGWSESQLCIGKLVCDYDEYFIFIKLQNFPFVLFFRKRDQQGFKM